MPTQTGNKLVIIKGKLQGKRIKYDSRDRSSVIEVCFNPPEYTTNKGIGFDEPKNPGLESPIIKYKQGDSQKFTLDLLLDTYTSYKGRGSREDLHEKYINRFEKLMDIDRDMHAPPPCKILWGTLEFIGVLENVKKNYTMFLGDGTPVRAKVTLEFKEYIPVDIQVKSNPRHSPDRLKTYLLKEGDSLWQLSAASYGDPDHWRVIAEANNIDNPKNLEPGKEIMIPILS
jgi:hypothetical protein